MTDREQNKLVVEGVGVTPGRYMVRGTARARLLPVLGLLALGLGTGYAGLAVWDVSVHNATIYNCPPDCGSPPNAVPVANLSRFAAPGFSVARPPDDPRWKVATGDDGVTATLADGGGVMRLYGRPAAGRVARQVVDDVLSSQYSSATIAYELPNAMVGYQIGYGVVADVAAPGLGPRDSLRVIVMAAVKNDLALIALAEGPFQRFTPDFGPGPPSAANLRIAMDLGTYVDSFSWTGDPPR